MKVRPNKHVQTTLVATRAKNKSKTRPKPLPEKGCLQDTPRCLLSGFLRDCPGFSGFLATTRYQCYRYAQSFEADKKGLMYPTGNRSRRESPHLKRTQNRRVSRNHSWSKYVPLTFVLPIRLTWRASRSSSIGTRSRSTRQTKYLRPQDRFRTPPSSL